MGFSTNLQGRAAHEALLCRQEAELRLLTTMRGCLVNKIKCDRQYADALASVVVQGRKIEKTEDLVGSLVTQAWKNMLEEIENTAKLIKQNADMVESRSVEKLNSLYAEKRKGMKLYQEEHNRIAAQFSHSNLLQAYLPRWRSWLMSLVVLSSTAEDGEIEVRISVG
uniref:FCH domain-containing protein n=1 Tax=Timema douglasi TaxID=61478 RepID=A0A7R8VAL4_TIMDO|nr:unnamed protein product [Timema douglasi]